MFTQKDRVQMENALKCCEKPLDSTLLPRWKRKALQAAAAANEAGSDSSKTPSKRSTASRKTPGKTPKVSILNAGSVAWQVRLIWLGLQFAREIAALAH